jgi:hypothetical protein
MAKEKEEMEEMDEFDAEVSRLKKRQGGLWVKVERDDNIFRILGPMGKTAVHFISNLKIIPEGSPVSGVVTCAQTKDKRCVVCEVVKNLLSSSREEDQQLAGKISAVPRYMWNVLVREGGSSSYKILEIGPQALEALSGVKKEWGDFRDPDDGYDVVINLGDKAGRNHYTAKARVEKKVVGGKPTQELCVSPLTEDEKALPLIDLVDMKTLTPEADLIAVFENAGYELSGKASAPKRTGKAEDNFDEPVVSKKPKAEEKKEEAPTPKFVKKGAAPVAGEEKKPKCWGTFEDVDELCGKCSHLNACAKAAGFELVQ